jgi:hypothetical protein
LLDGSPMLLMNNRKKFSPSSSSETPARTTSLSGSTSAATTRAVNLYAMTGLQQDADACRHAGDHRQKQRLEARQGAGGLPPNST